MPMMVGLLLSSLPKLLLNLRTQQRIHDQQPGLRGQCFQTRTEPLLGSQQLLLRQTQRL